MIAQVLLGLGVGLALGWWIGYGEGRGHSRLELAELQRLQEAAQAAVRLATRTVRQVDQAVEDRVAAERLIWETSQH